MAWVERRITRTSQPQGPCELNRFWQPKIIGFINAAFLVEEVGGAQLVLSGTAPAKTPTQLGLSIAGNASGVYYSQQPVGTVSTVIGCTLITVGTIPAVANGSIGGFGENAATGGIFQTSYDTTLGRIKTFFRGRAGGTTTERAFSQSGAQSGVFVSRISAANNIDVWLDGQPSNGTVPLATASDNNLWSRLSINGGMRNVTIPAASGTRSLLTAVLRDVTQEEARSLSENPWQLYEPEIQRIWVDDYVSAGGGATVIPIGVQATGSVGTPSATGAATAIPVGVSATASVGTPVAVGGASIPATVLPAGVQATSAIGAVSATGAAVAQPVGVTASGAVGTPVAIAGTSIPATVLPAGVQASSAVGTPTAKGAAIAQPLGVAATAYVGTPTIATGVSGVAVAYPAGVQAIGQVGTLIATGAAWTAVVGVQAVASVGTPTAYAGEIIIYVAGAQTRPSRLQSGSRPSRLQSGSRPSRLQTGTRASR